MKALRQVSMLALFTGLCLGEDGWNIQIADANEPGKKLVVSGVVSNAGGSPLPGVEIYVYHTDIKGHYGSDGDGKPRLNGTLVTDAEGRYRFTTVKPGHYPGDGPPAHIHFVISVPGKSKRRFELWFEGDPRLTKEMIARGERAVGNGRIRPVEKGIDGILRVERDFRL